MKTDFWQPIAEKISLQAQILTWKDVQIMALKQIAAIQERLNELEEEEKE